MRFSMASLSLAHTLCSKIYRLYHVVMHLCMLLCPRNGMPRKACLIKIHSYFSEHRCSCEGIEAQFYIMYSSCIFVSSKKNKKTPTDTWCGFSSTLARLMCPFNLGAFLSQFIPSSSDSSYPPHSLFHFLS